MFKRIILAIAVILPMSAFAQKFGVVNLETVSQAMPETAAMTNQLQEASKKFETEFQQLNEEINKLYAEYQAIAEDPNTPDSIKQRRISDIQERQQRLNKFSNTAQQDLNRLREQLITPIVAKMMDAVKAVGQEGGYTLILPFSEELILYQGNDVTDVTAEVKTKLGLK